MTEQPLVTIITPTYNFADLLPATIDSVLAQDYANFEYLILNDGSTDDTESVLARYDDPRLHWETHENMGESRTVNKGFKMGKGDYFIIVNGDDPVMPNMLSTAVAFMQSHPDVLAGYPRWVEIDDHGETLYEFPTVEFNFEDMVRNMHCMPSVGTIVRRTAIEAIGGRDTGLRWTSDYDMWLRIALKGPLARIPHILATHRVHASAKTYKDKGEAMGAEYVFVMKQFFARDDIPPHIRKLRRKTMATAHYIAGTFCFEVNHRSCTRKHYIRSIMYAPLLLFRQKHGVFRWWVHFLRIVFIPGWLRPLRLWLTGRKDSPKAS